MASKPRSKGTGGLRQLASGRWQARFVGPDGIRRPAPVTFETKLDARAWLKAQQDDVDRGIWTAPERREATGATRLRDYATTWLEHRDLTPRTRHEYRRLLDAYILPALGDAPLDRISAATVRAWYANFPTDRPTRRAHAYALLRAIFMTAVRDDDLLPANPCRIRGGGVAPKRASHRPASLPELEVIVERMPDRYRALVLLAAWCALRFGELAELRRGDIDLGDGVIRVRRAVTRLKGRFVIGDPKSEAGKRTVAIPPHLIPVLEAHLRRHVDGQTISGVDDIDYIDGHSDAEVRALGPLLFPGRAGRHVQPSTVSRVFYPAREAAGRPDLRFHDLRHTGATLAAATGATLAELMARLGHSTPAAALIYQHAAADRDKAIAEALSGFAGATVVPLVAGNQREVAASTRRSG